MVPAAIIGAILLSLADLAVRAIPLDRPLPIGVVTALFGTPMFLYLIVTMRRGVAS
jgi:iron complex transport system permease protein